MGFCFSKEVISPVIIRKITREDLSDLIYSKLQPRQMHINDQDYGLCNMLNHNFFLNSDPVVALQKLKGPMCLGNVDNFALVLLGRQKEWFSRTCSYLGSPFGYLIAEIEEDPRILNFFVDSNRALWLIDPRDMRVFVPSSSIQVSFLAV